MKFKFEGVPVELLDGKVICNDGLTKDLLRPIVEGVKGSPHDGYSQLNAITEIYGTESVTDIKNDDETVIH